MNTRAEGIQFAQRAMLRSAAVVHRQMSQGLTSLATVASLAPFFGVFGTLIGVVNSFKGLAGQRGMFPAAQFGDLSQACVSTGLGLLVAVPTLWFYKYLTAGVERFDREMENASIEIVNLLTLRPMYAAPASGPIPAPQPPIFRDHIGDELRDAPRPWHRSSAAVAVMLLASWYVRSSRYFAEDLPLESAATWGAVFVVFTFTVSWFLAYPAWVKVLRRSPGGLAAMASFACLCWSLAELWLDAHLW